MKRLYIITGALLLACGYITAMPLVPPAMAQTDPNATAAVPTALPVPQHVGNVTFITGGIGDEERTVIQQSKKDYNLYVLNSDTTGAFIGAVEISIANKEGTEVLNIKSGPLLNVLLPAGTYDVKATRKGQTFSHKVTVGASQTKTLDLKWQS